jgi:hypothetical protein
VLGRRSCNAKILWKILGSVVRGHEEATVTRRIAKNRVLRGDVSPSLTMKKENIPSKLLCLQKSIRTGNQKFHDINFHSH